MVSIIVPVYKSEKTLERCIQSMLDQKYRDFEIILIVDGPPDNSGILAEELAKRDSRIRVINQKNQGVSASRNLGLSEARGEYIRFVDSDDYIPPNSLDKLMEAMEQEDTDFVIGGYIHHYFGREIDKTAQLMGVDSPKDVQEKKSAVTYSLKEKEEYLYYLYREGFLNMPWNKVYKKELIQECFDRNWDLGEDLLFNLAYLQNCKRFTILKHPVYDYIQNESGSSLSTKIRDDKLSLTLGLYERVKKAFAGIFPNGKENPELVNKLVKEFLDDLESLAFADNKTKQEKKDLIHRYEKELAKILSQGKKPSLTKLDYRIIYFFLKRKMTSVTYLMIVLRGFIVKQFV